MTETVQPQQSFLSNQENRVKPELPRNDQIQSKTHIWAITNNPDSTLGKFAGCKLLLQAGTETAATTKTYVTTILVSWLLATAIIQEPNFSDRMREMMKKNVGFIEEFMKTGEESGKKMADFLGDLNRISCIGRGTSIATAQQAALNFKEIPKIGSEALTGSMFVHGSIELIDKDFRAVVIENNPVTTELNIKMVKNILTKWGGGNCIVITNQKEEWEKFKQELAEKDAAEQQPDTPAGDGTQAITPETPNLKLMIN